MQSEKAADHRVLAELVHEVVATTPVTDIHTHLYDPAFGGLLLWGIDDLLVYHYLVAEAFRYFDMPAERFWALEKAIQAELIWDQLFLKHSPVSEACRGVLTTLNRMGLEVRKRDLASVRGWFREQTLAAHVSRCLELAGVTTVYMTNSPFDEVERGVWEKGFARDGRFVAGLRLDPLLLNWDQAAPKLAEWGYASEAGALTKSGAAGVRRFLEDWTKRMGARYAMVSLPPDFAYPARDGTAELLEHALLPHCREHNLPLALMPGVKRAVNPRLGLAGDGVGLTDLGALQNLCAAHPENKFMATVLARENQHELCVLARKFQNLHIFGCWWFTNVPSLIREISTMRLELLGLSFTPQHSDARVLDQLVYKWQHSREVIGESLAEQYLKLAQTGWNLSEEEIRRDVKDLFGGAFERFLRR